MGKVSIVYWSGTGNTEAMAAAMAEGAKDAGAEVELLTVDKADAAALSEAKAFALGCFYTALKHAFVYFQPVISGSAKCRDQRWMDVDDLVWISIHHDLRDHDQTSCQNNEIRLIRLYFLQKCLVKCCQVCKIFR